MLRIVLVSCVLFALSCSSSFAQPHNGWTISYSRKSFTGTGNHGASTGVQGSSCYAGIYGSPNSSSNATVVTTMTLTKGANASATIAFIAESEIQCNLSASGNSCTSTVSGAQFTTNTYTLTFAASYTNPGDGPGNSRDAGATFDFTCSVNISGNNYGSGYAEGRYNFIP